MEWNLPKLLLIVLVVLMITALVVKYVKESKYFIPKPKGVTPYEFIQERLDLAKHSSNPAEKDDDDGDENNSRSSIDKRPDTIGRESKEKQKRHQDIIKDRHEGRLTLLENAVNYNLEQWRRHNQSKSVHNNMSKYNLKEGWCFIGKDRGYRSCLPVGKRDMCLSENIYPTREICINPSLRFDN